MAQVMLQLNQFGVKGGGGAGGAPIGDWELLIMSTYPRSQNL